MQVGSTSTPSLKKNIVVGISVLVVVVLLLLESRIAIVVICVLGVVVWESIYCILVLLYSFTLTFSPTSDPPPSSYRINHDDDFNDDTYDSLASTSTPTQLPSSLAFSAKCLFCKLSRRPHARRCIILRSLCLSFPPPPPTARRAKESLLMY